MPRKNLIRSSQFPYHVTARANNQKWFQLPMNDVWKICLDCLKEANDRHCVDVFAFVLMSNHYHLIVRTPNSNLDQFMYEFNKRLAFKLKDTTNNINHLLGGRYKWCLIQTERYFSHCLRYVYQNPRRAMIVENCQNYPYSTFHYIKNNKKFIVPIVSQDESESKDFLNWINEQIADDERELIQNGLRRSELKSLKMRSKRRSFF